MNTPRKVVTKAYTPGWFVRKYECGLVYIRKRRIIAH